MLFWANYKLLLKQRLNFVFVKGHAANDCDYVFARFCSKSLLILRSTVFMYRLFLARCFMKKLLKLNCRLHICDTQLNAFTFMMRWELMSWNVGCLDAFDWVAGGFTNFKITRWRFLKWNYPVFFKMPDYVINFVSKVEASGVWTEMVASGKPFISMLDYDGFDRCVHYSLLGGFNSRAVAYFYFYFFYELVKLDCYEKNKMFTKRTLCLKKIVLRLKKVALRRIFGRRRVKGRVWKRWPKRPYFKHKKNKIYYLLNKRFAFVGQPFRLKLKYVVMRRRILLLLLCKSVGLRYRDFIRVSNMKFLRRSFHDVRRVFENTGWSRYGVFLQSIESRLGILVWRFRFLKKRMRKLDIVELCNQVAFCVNGVRVENPFYYFVPANAVISWSFLANSLDGFCFFKHLFFRRFVPKYYLAGVPFETGLAELSDYRRIGGLRQGTTRLIRPWPVYKKYVFFVEVRRFFLSKFLRFACRRVRFRPVFLPDLIPKRVVINGVEFLYKKRFVRVRSGLLVGGGCLVGAPRSIVGRRFFLTGVGGAEVRKTGLAKGRGWEINLKGIDFLKMKPGFNKRFLGSKNFGEKVANGLRGESKDAVKVGGQSTNSFDNVSACASIEGLSADVVATSKEEQKDLKSNERAGGKKRKGGYEMTQKPQDLDDLKLAKPLAETHSNIGLREVAADDLQDLSAGARQVSSGGGNLPALQKESKRNRWARLGWEAGKKLKAKKKSGGYETNQKLRNLGDLKAVEKKKQNDSEKKSSGYETNQKLQDFGDLKVIEQKKRKGSKGNKNANRKVTAEKKSGGYETNQKLRNLGDLKAAEKRKQNDSEKKSSGYETNQKPRNLGDLKVIEQKKRKGSKSNKKANQKVTAEKKSGGYETSQKPRNLGDLKAIEQKKRKGSKRNKKANRKVTAEKKSGGYETSQKPQDLGDLKAFEKKKQNDSKKKSSGYETNQERRDFGDLKDIEQKRQKESKRNKEARLQWEANQKWKQVRQQRRVRKKRGHREGTAGPVWRRNKWVVLTKRGWSAATQKAGWEVPAWVRRKQKKIRRQLRFEVKFNRGIRKFVSRKNRLYLMSRKLALKTFFRKNKLSFRWTCNFYLVLHSWLRTVIFLKPPAFNSLFYARYHTRAYMRHLASSL